MNIKQFIEFLKTLPQDATVQVLAHYRSQGYYDQLGSCSVEDFSVECNKFQKGDKWAYGEHYELTTDSNGQMYLQLGVMDK